MSARCPRCGAEMSGGVCDNCGFPLTKIRKRSAVKHATTDGYKEKRLKYSKS